MCCFSCFQINKRKLKCIDFKDKNTVSVFCNNRIYVHIFREMNITGLQSLVRLTCHHSPLLSPVLHQVVVAVTRSVRNLRSQVWRLLQAINIQTITYPFEGTVYWPLLFMHWLSVLTDCHFVISQTNLAVNKWRFETFYFGFQFSSQHIRLCHKLQLLYKSLVW